MLHPHPAQPPTEQDAGLLYAVDSRHDAADVALDTLLLADDLGWNDTRTVAVGELGS